VRRARLQLIQTAAEISAHIKLLPANQILLYQKIAQKATELRLLGVPYSQIAKSLNMHEKTAGKTCGYCSI